MLLRRSIAVLVLALLAPLPLHSCTLTRDLDGLAENVEVDAGVDAPRVCEKGVDCVGCDTCETFCQCSAAPGVVATCIDQCLQTEADAGSD